MAGRVRVNISITKDTHTLLKEKAGQSGTSVSQIITDLIRKESGHHKAGGSQTCNRLIHIGTDTDDRLEQWAYEHHTTVDQAITDWIWKQKVDEENIRGQFRFR